MRNHRMFMGGIGVGATIMLVAAGCEGEGDEINGFNEASAALVGTINPTSNTDGRELATQCAALVTAPMSAADLVSSQAMAAGAVTLTGGQFTTSTRITATGPQVTVQRTAGAAWTAVGFFAQNGQGSLAPGGPANQAQRAPLLLEITARQGAIVRGKLRFWTYQGLKAAPGDLKFDKTGVPDLVGTAGTMENTAAYMGIALGNVTFDTLTIQVLNTAALAGPWTIDVPRTSAVPDNKTCWHADSSWHLVTNPNEYAPGTEPAFTHLLRTESHETHKGHTVGHYWELNVYNDPAIGPASGSRLENSGVSGNLTTPAIQLRDVPNMCDQIGQGDFLGLYHWSHFHFQGYHETDDRGYAESGIPFDFDTYCDPAMPENPYSRFCAGYETCLEKTNLSEANGLVDVLLSLGDKVCGATCLQTMQVERDACLGSPVPGQNVPVRDRRLSYYSLNNGRTWRRINHMNNRYHNGYPGEWHYNHAHPFEDSDGMLGVDHEGFDWDQDGILETSTIQFPEVNQADTQFGYLPPQSPPGSSYLSPAIRYRFRFEEKGSEPCDTRGDGYCAGWRLDDFGMDYNEECFADGARYFDTMGDPHTDFVGEVTPATVGAICQISSAAAAQAATGLCLPPTQVDLIGYDVVSEVHQHDQYVFDVGASPGCADPYQSCTKQICVESHGVPDGCYPYVRSCAPGPDGLCCTVGTPWYEHYCQP